MYMFTMRQELPGSGKREVRAALADADAAMAANDIAVRAREVVNEVMRTYADLAIARRAIDIHLDTVALLRQLADVSMVRYTAGRSGQHDVLKTIAELASLHEDLIMHEESAALAAARLNALLDRDPDTPIGKVDDPRADVTLPPSADLQTRAVDHEPVLKAAHLRVERAKASIAVASRERKPDFMVGGGYMLMPGEAGAWTASVGMTWPNAPWARGRLDARSAEANAELDASVAMVRSAEREIRLRVHEAYLRVVAAGQRASLLQTTVLPQTRQTIEASRIAYQADRLDLLALIDDQRALLAAELSYFRALSDRELALADLARAVGVEGLVADGAPAQEVR
jgi:outer membrane protein TolC